MKKILVVSVFFLQSCATYEKQPLPAYTLNEPVRSLRLDGGHLEWISGDATAGVWRIYSGAAISAIDWSAGSVWPAKRRLSMASDHSRVFFAAVDTARQDTVYFSDRQIAMEQVLNFRDLGGISAGANQQVKWGMLYRSGKIDELSERDLGLFMDLGIRTIIDLRSAHEIEDEPDQYPEGVKWINIPMGRPEELDRHEVLKALRQAQADPAMSEKYMLEGMQVYVDHAEGLRQVFDELLENDGLPLLIHCTSGKDRTGFVAAMILLALGVQPEDVMGEYLLSNYYRYEHNESLLKKASWLGVDHRALRPVLDVRKAYLQSGLDTIAHRYGSTEGYLRDQVGLDSTEILELRAKLLM